jgi:hypothetical protein
LDSYGLIVNRVEITNPGTTTIVTCEVLTKSSVLSKSTVGVASQSESSFRKDLDTIVAKIRPFFGDQKVVLRLTYLDGLLLQDTMKALEKTLQSTLKNKKNGHWSCISFCRFYSHCLFVYTIASWRIAHEYIFGAS